MQREGVVRIECGLQLLREQALDTPPEHRDRRADAPSHRHHCMRRRDLVDAAGALGAHGLPDGRDLQRRDHARRRYALPGRAMAKRLHRRHCRPAPARPLPTIDAHLALEFDLDPGGGDVEARDLHFARTEREVLLPRVGGVAERRPQAVQTGRQLVTAGELEHDGFGVRPLVSGGQVLGSASRNV
ncbi:MAG: hypothetical protein KJZ81_11630 [Burkholderiaceae bacterium]|nr:hypothetical protein [Burkholderiaceae bacterium]